MRLSTIPRGFYHDAFEPSGPVEVVNEAISIHLNARFVVLKVPGEGPYELLRPAEFNQHVTVKGPDGNATIPRFTPVIQDEPCQTTQRPND